MSTFLHDPLIFVVSGWSWLWQWMASTDGRIMLLAGILLWFMLERVMGVIYDPLLKAFALFLVVGVLLIAGTVIGGTKASPGGAMSFEQIYKPANMDDYQRVR